MIFISEVLDGGRVVTGYRGELGTVRRKGLAKIRQMAGRDAAQGRQVGRCDVRTWGDAITVTRLIDLDGRVVPFDTRLTSTCRVART